MENHELNIDNLILSVREKIGKPVSTRVVAATIESLGIRDKDTLTDFGVNSIKSLADLVFEKITNSTDYHSIKNKKELEFEKSNISPGVPISSYLNIKLKIFIKYYPTGIIHLLPIFIQILTIILFGYSLWTYIGFNHMQSTAVVLGVMVGLIATGGFVQVIGRQASFYWNYEDFIMTKKTIDYLVVMGIKSIATLLSFIFALNFFFHLYPTKLLLILSVYALLIGTLLLVVAPLHTIKQRWFISVAFTIATSFSVFLLKFSNVQIYFTHWIGILIAVMLCRIYLSRYFKRKIGKRQINSNMEIKTHVMIYQNYHYFIFGFLLYVFVFIDRMMAWSADISGQVPYVVYFENKYELGMDMAILVFLLLSGVLEYSLAAFSKFIDLGQKNTPFQFPELYTKSLYKMYWHQIGLLILSSIAIFFIIKLLIFSSWGYRAQFNENFSETSVRVCLIGGIGYLFFAWGMLNTLYLFTLGKPHGPLFALTVSCLVNLVAGFFFSRFISYEYSTIGLLLGSITFMLLTLRENINFFKNLDYYYYAAF